MEKPKRSGVIPYDIREGRIYVYCMIPSDAAYGGTSPQMAKGRVEPELTPFQNAKKEAFEELGLLEHNSYNFETLGMFVDIMVYTCNVIDEDDWGKPHFETGWSGWIDITDNVNKIRSIHQPAFKEVRAKALKEM